jgi:hypothetical protein
MPDIAFRPTWLGKPETMTSDDIGAYLVWLRHNMGKMSEAHRIKAKRAQHALLSETKRRRKKRDGRLDTVDVRYAPDSGAITDIAGGQSRAQADIRAASVSKLIVLRRVLR